MLCDDIVGWDVVWEAQEKGELGIHKADSLCYTAETNAIL